MSESAFDDYLAQWREASPQLAIAWLFLRHGERRCYGALAALEHEWLKALHGVREPQVAAAKLIWWREEVQRASQGQARHPLTQVLFDDAHARAVPLACWTAPVEASISMLAAPPPADFQAQCEAAAPLAGAIAELDTRVWFGAGMKSPRAGKAVLFAYLAANTRALAAEVERGRSPLPMNLLARHGLTTDALGSDGPSRRAALRDYLADLQRGLAAAGTMPGPLTLFRAAGLQRDQTSLARALQADDPMVGLLAPAHGLGNVLKTWRAARTWRSMVRIEPHP